MKKTLLLLFIIPALFVQGQNKKNENKIPAVVVGTFHFAYPNLDVIKVEKKDQIDILSKGRQMEIESIVQNLKRFKPTIIAIEAKTWTQSRIDSEYSAYIRNLFPLPKGEQYQIGFRLAKLLGRPKVYAIDTWGNIDYFMTTTDDRNFSVREERKQQMAKFDAFEDSLLKAGALEIQKIQKTGTEKYLSLQQILTAINEPEKLKRDHSTYFGQRFQFEAEAYDYTGADWVALTWYSRNLRIFRNIQRISNNPHDRILIIFGSGHAFLLNQLLNESLNYKAVSPLPYIKNIKE